MPPTFTLHRPVEGRASYVYQTPFKKANISRHVKKRHPCEWQDLKANIMMRSKDARKSGRKKKVVVPQGGGLYQQESISIPDENSLSVEVNRQTSEQENVEGNTGATAFSVADDLETSKDENIDSSNQTTCPDDSCFAVDGQQQSDTEERQCNTASTPLFELVVENFYAPKPDYLKINADNEDSDFEIPVLRPTPEEFQLGVIKYVTEVVENKLNLHKKSGIVKIIPPEGIVKIIPPEGYNPRADNYEHIVENNISKCKMQVPAVGEGRYFLHHHDFGALPFSKFIELSNSWFPEPPGDCNLPQLVYDRNLLLSRNVLYDTDVADSQSLFDEECCDWISLSFTHSLCFIAKLRPYFL